MQCWYGMYVHASMQNAMKNEKKEKPELMPFVKLCVSAGWMSILESLEEKRKEKGKGEKGN